MRYRVSLALFFLAAALPLLTDTGQAPAQELVRAPDQIRACLCQEQSVATLDTALDAARRRYEDSRRTFETLDQQVTSGRPLVNVNNPDDIDSFKRLLERRNDARAALAGEATANYTDAVTRYNQAVTAYNRSCAGRAFDADMLAEVRRTLSCPKP